MAVHSKDSALVGLALQVARTPAATLDVGAMLAGLCTALPMALGVAGAVVVVLDAPDPMSGPVFASDAAARRLGDRQFEAAAGPLMETARSGRVTATADMTRVAPPEVAGIAVETGLGSAVSVPIFVDGRPAGALQLLGASFRPVPAALAEAVRPLLDVLGTRLADGRGFAQLYGAVARATAVAEAATPVAHAVGRLAERYHTDVEEAARFLASQAARAGLTAEAMAASIVAGTDRPEVPGPRPPQEAIGRRRLREEPPPSDAAGGPPTDPLGWIRADLPLPRSSQRRPGGRRRLGEPPDSGPQPARHRRADIS